MVKTFKHTDNSKCDYTFKAEVEDYVDILYISCPKCGWLRAFTPNINLDDIKDKFKIYKFEILDEYKEDFEPKKKSKKRARKKTTKRNSIKKERTCNTIYKLNLNQ